MSAPGERFPSAAAPRPAAAAVVAPADPVGRVWVRGLLLTATLVSILAIIAIWANRQLLNPTNWSNTSTSLLQKPSVRKAVSGFLVDQLYVHVDIGKEIGTGLPKNLHPLAGPLAGVLHSAAEDAAATLLAQPRVQDAWRAANRAADEQLIRVTKGQRGIRLGEETVSLELRPIVRELAKRLGISESIVNKLPPSVAEVKIITWSDVGLVRDIARALRPLALTLISLAVVLYALALSAARGYRRRTLMEIGVSLVLAGLLVLAARKIAQPQAISAITKDASIEPAADDAYSVATSLLVQAATSPIIIGIPFILAAWLAGPASWAVALRRFLAPRARLHPAFAYGVAAALLALVFAWGPIPATRNPFEMSMFTILTLVGADVLRRQMASEFPDGARLSLRAMLREQARELVETVAQSRMLGSTPPAPGAPPSVPAELERLAALRERGAITDEEFTAAKRSVLSSS